MSDSRERDETAENDAVSRSEEGKHSARERLSQVTVRLAGDSGDGVQITGSQFTTTSALAGNDVATLPDYPAEIRAPAGTLAGVSGFQLHFADHRVLTPGDQPDVLVAFNPAALKANIDDLKRGGILIVNEDAFEGNNLRKAGYEVSPLEDDSLSGYRMYAVGMTRMTREALKDSGLTTRAIDRCKNFFALGMLYWLHDRSLDPTIAWLQAKFARKPELAVANETVLRAGYHYCDTIRVFQTVYEIPPASLPAGTYRNVDGNEAIALALAAIAHRSGLRVLLGSYPITPASSILHRASSLKAHGVHTFQAEDEIASIGAALGCSFGGGLGVTSTAGPGVALKSETISLAAMVELPLLIIDVQRAGPSTGLPTKTEQGDLLMAMYGRHGEAPLPVLAAASPATCFEMTLEAARIALEYMTPVILLSEGYLANGTEPWRVPEIDDLPDLRPRFLTDPADFRGVYERDEATLARPWIAPGTPGLEHRIGGLEKDDHGSVSYDPENHERMTALRAAKVEAVAATIPEAALDVGDTDDEVLVVGWGGSYGAITQAVEQVRESGGKVAAMHLRYLNPFPRGLEALLRRFDRILLPELNGGQLQLILQGRFGIAVEGYHKVQGLPFKVTEIKSRIMSLLGDRS